MGFFEKSYFKSSLLHETAKPRNHETTSRVKKHAHGSGLLSGRNLVGTMQKVQDAQHAKTRSRIRVVAVVEVRLAVARGDPRETVARVVCLCTKARPDNPLVHEENMWAQRDNRGGKRHEVREQKLNGVCVQRREGVGRREFVVLLVEAPVQCAVVEGAMRIVKEDFVRDNVADEQV